MTIYIDWDTPEKQVVRFDIESTGDWSEFRQAVKQANALINSVDHTVDLIINPQPGAEPGRGAMPIFKNAQLDAPANQGVTVIVETKLFARMLVNAFCRVYRDMQDAIIVVASLEDARRVLRKRNIEPASIITG